MHVQLTTEKCHEIDADVIVIGVEADQDLEGAAADFDQATDGLLTTLIESQEITGAANSLTTIYEPPGVNADIAVVVGLGDNLEDPALSFKAAGSAAKQIAAKKRQTVAFYLDALQIDDAVCGSIVGCHGQDLFRKEKNIHPFETLIWSTDDETDVRRGEILGNAINLTRRVVNLPASEIYPETFVAECEHVAEHFDIDLEVWDQDRLESEGCGALLAVARGSERPPRLAILSYMAGPEDQEPLALVGKGVTFDSGGLSLKPSEFMMDMKCDMAGAATVLGAIQAIARLKIPVNVVGLVGLAENMVSGRSYKLGDVLKTRNGKTVEVHNTDAEGRLVLADVLDVALSRKVGKIVDLATLTGACMVALGKYVAGVMTNDQAWCDTLIGSAEVCGESIWQLPMDAEFGEQIRSQVADIKNVGEGRWGGAITAAKFLEEFVGDTPWSHIDIAGPSFLDKPLAWMDAGATGCMVRTLVELATRYSSEE